MSVGSTWDVSLSNAYSDEHRPLAAYGLLTAAFGALFGGATTALHDRIPDRPRATDVALTGVATDRVTSLVCPYMAHAEAMPS